MNILIDIGHPAHVHLFKNFAWEMMKDQHKVLFTAKDKEIAVHLLKAYKFDFVSLGKPFKGVYGKVLGLLGFNWKLFRVALKFKPDIFISHGSMYAAQVAWLMGKPHVSLEDTGNMEQVRLYRPFTRSILTSTVFHKDLGPKQLRYAGNHEIAYLHPAIFKPDQSAYQLLGIEKNRRYILIRTVSWNASHDAGQQGLTEQYIRQLVNTLSQEVAIFISAEGKLPDDLEVYRIKIPPEEMHNVLANASLFIGEGATMASECAILGTPAIYINTMEAGTIDEQEQYGLVFHFRKSDGILEKAREILLTTDAKENFLAKRDEFLAQKINVTAFLVWFIKNYPQSHSELKANPDCQFKFVS